MTEPAKEVRPTLQDARINAALDKPVRENGEQMTRRQWVERKVSDGLKTRITQEDRIKPMSRMAYFRANNEEQRAHERRVKEAGKKDVYWIGDYEVTKIEHDYAKRLAEQPATPTPAPQGGEGRAPANVSPAAPAIDTSPQRVEAPADDRQNDTAAKPKPHAELEGKTIEQEMEVEGHKVVRRRDAAKALRALDEREASLRALLECLKGGG